MIHPITAILHYRVAKEAAKWNPKSIIDIGGVGKLRSFIDCEITDANKIKGFDGTNLKFQDNSFDVAISVATLEHVDNQQKFLDESIRVARIAAIHWFPYGDQAANVEEFKKRFSTYSHPCKIPAGICEGLSPFISVSEHLLMLATLYEEMNCIETYDYVGTHGHKNYGTLMVVNK